MKRPSICCCIIRGRHLFFPLAIAAEWGSLPLLSHTLSSLCVAGWAWLSQLGGDTKKTTAKNSSYVFLYIVLTLLKWIIQRPCFSSACSAILWQQGLPPISRKIWGLAGLNVQYMFGMSSCVHIAVYLDEFPSVWMDLDGSYPWSCQWLFLPPPSL